MSSGAHDATLAVVQFGSTLDRAANIATALARLDDLVARGRRLDRWHETSLEIIDFPLRQVVEEAESAAASALR